MNILDKIVMHKRAEVEKQKRLISVRQLEQSLHFKRFPLSFSEHIVHGSGVVAEHKRRSPSKGIINDKLNHIDVIAGYQHAGASAVSVLTDEHFFGGNLYHLETARHKVTIPLLRKDFIIDSYQVMETKSAGADAILLIARILTKQEVSDFTSLAQSHGMEVLLEVHSEQDLDKISPYVDVVGINNRNLQSFEVDIQQSINLFNKLPKGNVKIAESGIDSPKKAALLKKAGFDGFLMGEYFMRTTSPPLKCKTFINQMEAEYVS
jgi:indole-3-glycerol phosphate synthase